MKVGAKEIFPLEQYSSINTIIYNHLSIERSKGMRWSVKAFVDDGTMTVTRTL